MPKANKKLERQVGGARVLLDREHLVRQDQGRGRMRNEEVSLCKKGPGRGFDLGIVAFPQASALGEAEVLNPLPPVIKPGVLAILRDWG